MPIASACRASTVTHTHTQTSDWFSFFHIPRKNPEGLFLCTSLSDSFFSPLQSFYRYFESIVSYVCIYSLHIQYIFSGRVLYMGMHSLALQPYFSSGFSFLSYRKEKERFNLTKQMEVDKRRLFPLCRTWLGCTQEWENLECSISEWDGLSSWMRASEARLDGSPRALSHGCDFTEWHWGISLKEYLHTLRVQNTCVPLQPPVVSGSTHTHTHTHTHWKKHRIIADSTVSHGHP